MVILARSRGIPLACSRSFPLLRHYLSLSLSSPLLVAALASSHSLLSLLSLPSSCCFAATGRYPKKYKACRAGGWSVCLPLAAVAAVPVELSSNISSCFLLGVLLGAHFSAHATRHTPHATSCVLSPALCRTLDARRCTLGAPSHKKYKTMRGWGAIPSLLIVLAPLVQVKQRTITKNMKPFPLRQWFVLAPAGRWAHRTHKKYPSKKLAHNAARFFAARVLAGAGCRKLIAPRYLHFCSFQLSPVILEVL